MLATQDRPPDFAAQTHQPDKVGTVGVVVERDEADLVAPDRRVVQPLALIGDVAHHVAVLVLRPRLAQVHADAPVQHGQFVIVIAVGVESRDADETPPVDQVAFDPCELFDQPVEREILAPDLQKVVGLSLGVAQRAVELGMIGGGQDHGPLGRILDIL